MGEELLANKQVWVSRMEAAISAKEKVNEIGTRGANRRNLKKEGA